MELLIDFPGGARVDAHIGPFTIPTDQPINGGGQNSAPAPFTLFLASLGTCAGIYVLSFCNQRNLPTQGIRIIERLQINRETGHIDSIDLEIQVPPDFPEKYYDALIRSAEQCKVKKLIENPPEFKVYTKVAD